MPKTQLGAMAEDLLQEEEQLPFLVAAEVSLWIPLALLSSFACLIWSQGWLTNWLPAWRPTSMSQLKAVETRILQCIQNKFSSRFVSLPDQNKIWTVTLSPEQNKKTPLVMLHGFGGGVGLWIQNMDSLSSQRTLHAFDLLGFGRSSRPKFPQDPEGAEDAFVSSIEKWREEMGIGDMILLGHSMGGFLAAAYSIKYPDRVKHLILVDPWGFPMLPTDPSEMRSPPRWVKAVASVLARSNPLAVLRAAGPWGPGLVQKFRPDFKRKFAEFFDDETISEYIYHCNAQTPRLLKALPTMCTLINHMSSMRLWRKSVRLWTESHISGTSFTHIYKGNNNKT
ncbi:(Lyso)-N-acylphosphatidylethanolamine lipase isoform X3 [Ambystoma mexicanum]|uniref:(Lyso)-N-acylphosphatidylethanolamine lipase isoform X3 n=1 Tax=Ambystoma mexicanum TaxID=8296 RepID=UPI0037E9AEC5